jgi:hypothetical protein
VTICVRGGECLLEEVVGGVMQPAELGRIVVHYWQRNYWEHVVRSDGSLNRIREYIRGNPARWDEDQLHPNAPPNPFNQWPAPQEND